MEKAEYLQQFEQNGLHLVLMKPSAAVDKLGEGIARHILLHQAMNAFPAEKIHPGRNPRMPDGSQYLRFPFEHTGGAKGTPVSFLQVLVGNHLYGIATTSFTGLYDNAVTPSAEQVINLVPLNRGTRL